MFWAETGELWFVAVVSFLTAIIIVLSRRFHISATTRGHAGLEVQSMHDAPTPRIGGLAVIVGIVASYAFLPGPSQHLLGLLLLSALPALIAGFSEDLNFEVSPKRRLIAAACSSALMIALSGQMLTASNVPGLNVVLSIAPVAFVFTIFATCGMTHALNLIDGLNGLAGGIALAMAGGLGLIAFMVGDAALVWVAAAMFTAIMGFLLVNFPLGKVFLGDGGAYTLGHILAWIAILLLARNPDISAWSLILCAFWPLMDTFATIARRLIERKAVGAPDRLHFHHIMMRLVRTVVGPQRSRLISNSIASALLAPLYILPVTLGVLTVHNSALGFLSIALCGSIYVGLRFYIVRRFPQISRKKIVTSLRRRELTQSQAGGF